jgi:hypothetical protein
MIRGKKILLIVALVTVLLALATLKMYFVQSSSGGTLIWNAHEAYVFIPVAQSGYRMSCIGLIVEFVREIFPFGASAPDDKHSYAEVRRITPDAVQRYIFDNMNIDPPVVVGQTIYVADIRNNGIGGVMKWSDTHFERASPEEQGEYRTALASGKVPSGPDYDNVNGWSKRAAAGEVTSETPTTGFAEKDARVRVTLDGKPLTFVMNSGYISHEAYIDLSRPGQPNERIWYLDGRTHRISGAKYKHIFGSR